MTRITIDADTQRRIRSATGPVEVCDTSGQVIGYFLPLAERSLYESADVPFDESELRLREHETEHFTTREVLDRLGA